MTIGERGFHRFPKNRLLSQLPEDVWALLRQESTYKCLPAGVTFARIGEPRANFYFPETGLVAWMTEMESGQNVEIASLGAEGFCNVALLLGVRDYTYSGVVLVESQGYWMDAAYFMKVFNQSEALQRVTLGYAGVLMLQIARNAACYRLHLKGQRLARWLLSATEKLGDASLPLTHDVLAQQLGGPRHTVTLALHALRERGAIDYHRGNICIVDRDLLMAEACECYAQQSPTTSPHAPKRSHPRPQHINQR